MRPFDDYPGDGYSILRTLKGAKSRQGYAHWLVEHCQTSCAYCGTRLVDSYEHWLLLTVDHVIPVSEKDLNEGHWLGIPRSWHESYSNIVLACSGCNGFRNKYKVAWQEPKESWKEAEFFEFRDRVFQEKAALIEEARNREMRFYRDRVQNLVSNTEAAYGRKDES